MSVFATPLTGEIWAWRGVRCRNQGGSRTSWPLGGRWGSGLRAGLQVEEGRHLGASGDSGDTVLSLVLAVPWVSPAWCQCCRCDALEQDAYSDPSPCVRPLSGPLGGEVCGGVSLFLLLQSCVWQQGIGSAAQGLDSGPESALSLPEPQFLSWVTEWSWEWGR